MNCPDCGETIRTYGPILTPGGGMANYVWGSCSCGPVWRDPEPYRGSWARVWRQTDAAHRAGHKED